MVSNNERNRLDPNRADLEALTALPGVGQALAGRIVQARPFQAAEDLLAISGIGRSKLARISPHLEFGQHAAAPVETAPRLGRAPRATSAAGDRSQSKPRPRSWGLPAAPDSLWTYAGVAVISVLLSVLITLGVLAGINRTLDFGQHRALLSLESEFDAVRAEIETLSSSLDAVGRRLEAVEGLNGRVAAVELELEGMRTSINAVVEEMEATRTSLTALSEHVDELTRSVLRFDTFLEGLREVLDEIDLTSVPATSEGS